MLHICADILMQSFICRKIEDLKFTLSTTEDRLLESNSQLQSTVSELQLCKDHCVKLEENRNDLTVQLERSRNDLREVCA